tara:strand:- start:335 stop:484 length:150 start_codon:yes stop_codon:yes gene_type:complete
MEIRIYDQETDNEVDRIHLDVTDGKPSKELINNILSAQYNLNTVYWSIM